MTLIRFSGRSQLMAFVALLALLGRPYSALSEGPQVPKLTLVDAEFNFGTVTQGTKVQHAFAIRNDGTAPLAIRRVQPSCGCTVSVADKTTLEPGQESAVQAVFDTSGFHGQKVIPIRLYTNDPRASSAELTLRGVVRQDVELTPPRLSFGAVPKGSSQTKSAEVWVDSKSTLQILDVSTRSDAISIKTENISAPGRSGKKIEVTLKDNIPVGTFRTLVAIKTNSPTNGVVNIPVFAKVEGDLRFEPADVSFGLVEGPLQKPLSLTVTLVSQATRPVSISSIKSDNSDVVATLEKSAENNRSTIKVTLPRGFIGTLKSRIQITTDHPDPEQQQLVLPVYGIVAEKGA